jgi:hypothetical protein
MLPAILPTVAGKGVHIITSRFNEVKTDGSSNSNNDK